MIQQERQVVCLRIHVPGFAGEGSQKATGSEEMPNKHLLNK